MKSFGIVLLIFFFMSHESMAQSAEENKLKAAVESLDKALVDTNRKALESITAEDLSYGHSTGKIEDRQTFISGVFSSPIHFLKIEASDFHIKVYGNMAVLRHVFLASVTNAGNPETIKLHILQVWQKQKGSWKLLARQAVKI